MPKPSGSQRAVRRSMVSGVQNQQKSHQARGLQRIFSGQGPRLVSVLAGPSAPSSHEFVLALAAELSRNARRVWLVDTGSDALSSRLGCRPLLPWRASQPLDDQVISAGAYGLLHAPGCLAGDVAFASAAASCRSCDFLLVDGGRFGLTHAPLDPASAQTLIVLLGKHDAEAGYALAKALAAQHSPAQVLLLGEASNSVAQAVKYFDKQNLENLKSGPGLYQIDNNGMETSSNTLTIEANLRWVVSRIMQNDQPKVAHGGCG
jgi:hypothetical protein